MRRTPLQDALHLTTTECVHGIDGKDPEGAKGGELSLKGRGTPWLDYKKQFNQKSRLSFLGGLQKLLIYGHRP
jgi:hypothetical protein